MDYGIRTESTQPVPQYLTAFPIPVKTDLLNADIDVYKRQLHDAADRGVHIRLLVDGMESWIDMEGNPYFNGLSSHEMCIRDSPDTVVKRYHFTPAKITVDEHHIGVYAGKEGGHMKPVSYTHLDVYKRQVMMWEPALMKAGFQCLSLMILLWQMALRKW